MTNQNTTNNNKEEVKNDIEHLKQLAIDLELFKETAKEKFLEYYKDENLYNKDCYELDTRYLLEDLNNSILTFIYRDNEGDEWTKELPLEWFYKGETTKPARTFLNGFEKNLDNSKTNITKKEKTHE